jgi:N6-L-threonylcarbamoyladenine synthase
VNFAKALSYFWNIPVVPVNHIESHVLVNLLQTANHKLPAIALVVSGGHTQIILVEKIGSYKILGETRDDAAGECFDKCAKILGLGYPGGPIISRFAKKIDRLPMSIQSLQMSVKLPRPMINTKDYDFSFSGLKTAVLYTWQKWKKSPVFHSSEKAVQQQAISSMCVEIQQAIIDVLIKKTIKATKDYNAKTIILGGGVSANSELRKQFQKAVSRHCEGLQLRNNLNLIFPPANLSTDNALMTAITGYFHKKSARSDLAQLRADANLRIGQ